MQHDATTQVNQQDDATVAAILHANASQFPSCILEESEVKRELLQDKFLQRIMSRVIKGRWSGCSQAENAFKKYAERLTIENGMLYLGTRLYIPQRLRNKVFDIMRPMQAFNPQPSI